ncbi:Nei Formamidopyrimidine-DNA glycosylase [Rhabdaerophilaceae bacterium]
MPELPEVETVKRGLAPVLEGATIAHVTLNRAGLRFPFQENFALRLADQPIGTLGRRAKYLLVPLGSGETLIIHLGMSGRVVVETPGMLGQPGLFHKDVGRLPTHDHVVFDLSSGARIIYNDVRRFGFMWLAPSDGLENDEFLHGLGPEPLGNAFHASDLLLRLKGRMTPIKSALLDQKAVAGLGNIYVCEALHRAGVSPFRTAARITRAEADRLVAAIRAVLEEAIAAGGSTLRDFRHEDGSLGYFQHRFRVYDRAGEPCLNPACSGGIMREVQAGRSSFYCTSCQR